MRSVCSYTIGIILLAGASLSLPARSAAGEATVQDPSAAPASHQTLSPEQRGDLLMARHQYLAAIDAYRDASGDPAVIWNKTGIAYHHLFAMDAAKMDYERALRLNQTMRRRLITWVPFFTRKRIIRRPKSCTTDR